MVSNKKTAEDKNISIKREAAEKENFPLKTKLV